MFGNRMKYAFLALAVFALIGYSGCILSPDEEVPPPNPPATYKPLTEKENVIYNLMQCYKEHNIDRYIELLHADYIWYNQEGSDPAFLLRATDITQTGKMFAAAKNSSSIDPSMWLDKLELIIYAGTWEQLTEFEGAPCDDCWETLRTYQITARINGGATTYVGYDDINFIVKGVDSNGRRIYLLRRAEDKKKP